MEHIWEYISSKHNDQIYRTLNSSWYIDKGVKIERFDKDGKIEIMNTMVQSDFHEPISSNQEFYFDKYGWDAGCTSVQIDSTETKINRLYALLEYYGLNSKSDEATWAKEQIDNLTKKRRDLVLKLKKIMQTL